MSVEKLIQDGKVAVIYSPGFGAGWSTWNDEYAEDLIFNKDIAQAILDDNQDKAKEIAESKYPKAYIGSQELVIAWLNQGEQFIIKEYDGAESVRTLKELKPFTA